MNIHRVTHGHTLKHTLFLSSFLFLFFLLLTFFSFVQEELAFLLLVIIMSHCSLKVHYSTSNFEKIFFFYNQSNKTST